MPSHYFNLNGVCHYCGCSRTFVEAMASWECSAVQPASPDPSRAINEIQGGRVSQEIKCPICGRPTTSDVMPGKAWCNWCGQEVPSGSKENQIKPTSTTPSKPHDKRPDELGRKPSISRSLPIERSEILLEAANPNLYRTNAFRVTALTVDATARVISKQEDKLKMMERFGNSNQTRTGALSLIPPPDMYSIREAMARIKDPERRLVDEFFWFWPTHVGETEKDDAYCSLVQGRVEEATRYWIKQEFESSNGNVSKHNLAVLAHIIALDAEYRAVNGGLDRDFREPYWEQAYKRWTILIDHEGFWSRLTSRIREFDDPRLTAGTARRIRATLPLALLSINAQLAIRAAEAGKDPEVNLHLRIIASSGLQEETQNEALHRAIKPTRDRIKALCKSGEERSTADPLKGAEEAQRILVQSKPLLRILSLMVSEGNPTRDGAQDEVALSALQCLVKYGNETEDWGQFLKALHLILPVAATEPARIRIEDNIRIVKQNHRMNVCWFCEVNPVDDEAVIKIEMYGDVNTEYLANGTRLTWQYGTFRVPRCKACKHRHGAKLKILAISCLTGFLLAGLLVLFELLTSTIGEIELIAVAGIVLWFFTCIGGALLAHVKEITLTTEGGFSIKPISKRLEYPDIVELLKKGWKLGTKPPEAEQ